MIYPRFLSPPLPPPLSISYSLSFCLSVTLSLSPSIALACMCVLSSCILRADTHIITTKHHHHRTSTLHVIVSQLALSWKDIVIVWYRHRRASSGTERPHQNRQAEEFTIFATEETHAYISCTCNSDITQSLLYSSQKIVQIPLFRENETSET